MKNIFATLVFLLLFSNLGSAQYEPAYGTTSKAEPKVLKAYYLGLGSGIYGKYGILGIDFGVRLSPKIVADVNFGLGNWGSKTGFSFTTFVGDKKSWCPSIGFTRNYGGVIKNENSKVLLSNSSDEFTLKSDLNYKPINIIHLSLQKQFVSNKCNRFFIELGYSMAISEVVVEFDQASVTHNGILINTSNLEFTDAQKQTYKIQAPNGINISLGYQFGLGKYN